MKSVSAGEDEIIRLSHREFLKVDRDHAAAAAAAHLVYIRDTKAGIRRVKKGKGFTYKYDNRPLKSEDLVRIKRLVLPPAWTNVWICPLANGHIQATGLDLRGRKQYRYHELWNTMRNETKFHRLYEFGKALPQIRRRVERDLGGHELTQEKVLALVISLMERTYIRIGNSEYEKANGSYGLTTLKDEHVAISGAEMSFSFNGKKGIHHDISLHHKRLARTVKECRDVPGKELFQYYDRNRQRHAVDSGMVNGYIRAAAGDVDFTAKDFRTWAGSLHALHALRSVGEANTATQCRKNIVTALDLVSNKLGNTRTVCRKYYVHPSLLKLYEENKLAAWLGELDRRTNHGVRNGLTAEEQVLIKILNGKGKH